MNTFAVVVPRNAPIRQSIYDETSKALDDSGINNCITASEKDLM